MSDPIKQAANLVVLVVSAMYGLWSFAKFMELFFFLGDNDPGLTMIGFFVFGLLPFPAALIAVRWRKPAALLCFMVALVTVAGIVDDSIYMANRNGTAPDVRQSVMSGFKLVWPLLIFASYYLATDLLRWPIIRQLLALPQKES